MNYYNEFDPKAAAWLRELIKEGLIPPGDVDERSIVDVKAADLAGYDQYHFFAGIGGWSRAFFIAGIAGKKGRWTGSCPCQPFSDAGEGLGTADPRHLWPHFFRLIRECRPDVVYGEQVASKAALAWLDGVFDDLEGAGYACGAADFSSAVVGAPHIRQRLYWVAESDGWKSCHSDLQRSGEQRFIEEDGGADRLAHAGAQGRGALQRSGEANRREEVQSDGHGDARRLGNPKLKGLEGHSRNEPDRDQSGRLASQTGRSIATPSGLGYWDAFDVLLCTDNKARRIEPGSFPLAHGIPGRVGLLRGYGNAINPIQAACFIEACEDAMRATP